MLRLKIESRSNKPIFDTKAKVKSMRLYRSTLKSRRRENARRFHELRIQNENLLIDMVEGSVSKSLTDSTFELKAFYSSHSHTVENCGI